MKTLLMAWAALIWGAAVVCAAEVPRLPEYVEAVRRDPTQVGAAQRLASALFHRDWMCPASPPLVQWLEESPRVTDGLAVPSPDGKRRLEVEGRRLRLVTLPDVSLMAEVEVGVAPVTVAWHPSGCVVALASERGVEIRDGRGLKVDPIRLRDAVGPALGFSGDGVWLVTGMRGGGVGLWDWAGARCVSVGVPGLARVTSARFASAGLWVSVGYPGGQMTLDARPGAAFDGWFGSTSAVQTAVFNPSGTRVVSVDVEGLVQSADGLGSGPVKRVRLAMPPRQVSLSPDDGWMGVALASSKVRMWGWSDARPMGAWISQPGAMWTAVDRGGNWLWSAGTTRVSAESMKPGKEQRHLSVSNEPVHRVVSDWQGRWVAALTGAGTNGAVRVWSMTNPAVEVAHVGVTVPGSFDMDPEGTWILLSGTNGGLRQVRVGVGGVISGRETLGGEARFDGARYSADGGRILTLTGTMVQVWDAQKLRAIGAAISLPGVSFERLELSKDGEFLRVEYQTGDVELRRVGTGEVVSIRWNSVGRLPRGVSLAGRRMDGEGRGVLVPDDSGGVRWVPLLPLGAAPAWLGELALAVWGAVPETAVAAVGKVGEKLRLAETKDVWTDWGRWWLSDRTMRTTSPGSSVKVSELATQLVRFEAPTALGDAVRMVPGDGAIRAAFGQQLKTNLTWDRPHRVEQGQFLTR